MELNLAGLAGADAFITGEISEPQAHLAREMGVSFIAAGHPWDALWASLAAIVVACVAVNPLAGIGVALLAAAWLTLIGRRGGG